MAGVSKNHPAYRELVDHWEETPSIIDFNSYEYRKEKNCKIKEFH